MNTNEKQPTYYKITRTFTVCGKVENIRVIGNCCYKTEKAAIVAAKKYIKKIEKYSKKNYTIISDGKYPLEAVDGNDNAFSIRIRVEALSPEERETIALARFWDFIKSPNEFEE